MLAALTSAVFFGISYASPCIDIPVAQVSLSCNHNRLLAFS